MKIIKRYANRKLYDTARSSYITLDEIAQMVREGEELQIIDQKTEEDLTSVTLAQILFEEEKRSRRFLPIPALRSIIQTSGELLHKLSLPMRQFHEETQRSMKQASEVLDGGRQAVLDYIQNFNKAVEEMQRRLDERVKDIVDALTHLPKVETQLVELFERIETLEERVRVLSHTTEQILTKQSDGETEQ